jgi:hypothetical protein
MRQKPRVLSLTQENPGSQDTKTNDQNPTFDLSDMTQDTQKNPQQNLREPNAQTAAKAGTSVRYVAPQIISHSAQELERQSLRVNACSSYFP